MVVTWWSHSEGFCVARFLHCMLNGKSSLDKFLDGVIVK